jgi:hypothetical protein
MKINSTTHYDLNRERGSKQNEQFLKIKLEM